jgi:YVTN family beta-propeller protein
MLDRLRGVAGSLAVAFLVGAAALPSDSFGANVTFSPLVAPQELKTSGEPFGIAVDAQAGRAYVTDIKDDTLFVFDVASGGALAYIPTGHQPNHVVLSKTMAFVSNFGDGSMSVIDTSLNRVSKTLPVGGLGLASNAGTGRVYAAAGSRVLVLDGASGATIASLAAPAGANLWGLAVDPAANRVYATDIANPRVVVFDEATGKQLGEIAIDAPARFGIAVGASGRIFVASYTDQSPQLSMIDGATLKVVAHVPVASFATSLLVDTEAGVVYASSLGDRSVTAISSTLGGAPSKTSLTQVPGGLAINPVTKGLIVATPGGAAPPARRPVDGAPVRKA